MIITVTTVIEINREEGVDRRGIEGIDRITDLHTNRRGTRNIVITIINRDIANIEEGTDLIKTSIGIEGG